MQILSPDEQQRLAFAMDAVILRLRDALSAGRSETATWYGFLGIGTHTTDTWVNIDSQITFLETQIKPDVLSGNSFIGQFNDLAANITDLINANVSTDKKTSISTIASNASEAAAKEVAGYVPHPETIKSTITLVVVAIVAIAVIQLAPLLKKG